MILKVNCLSMLPGQGAPGIFLSVCLCSLGAGVMCPNSSTCLGIFVLFLSFCFGFVCLFLMDTGNPKSGPHVCRAGVLLTEPIPHPSDSSFSRPCYVFSFCLICDNDQGDPAPRVRILCLESSRPAQSENRPADYVLLRCPLPWGLSQLES